jgi:lipid-A-disaccharide synthase
MTAKTLKIAIVAGEASGDILGGGLARALNTKYPNVEIRGVAGPEMRAAGVQALADIEELAVFGIFEVLKHLPRLLKLRKRLKAELLEWRPDVMIGIDAPDFNLGLETYLREQGIKTVHYVSPTVWAWREKRVEKVAKAVDHVLCLFPFEVDFYAKHNVAASCVGHTLADKVPERVDRPAAREALGLPLDGTLVALLPGSRAGEVKRLGELFVATAKWLLARHPELQFAVPCNNDRNKAGMAAHIAAAGLEDKITLIDGRSREVMAAADAILLASGTAALEGLLVKRPMVVAYKISPLTYWLVMFFKLMKIDQFSLPNLLAGRDTIPELMQDDAEVEKMGQAVLNWLEQPEKCERLLVKFDAVHKDLKRNASDVAADAVLKLAGV